MGGLGLGGGGEEPKRGGRVALLKAHEACGPRGLKEQVLRRRLRRDKLESLERLLFHAQVQLRESVIEEHLWPVGRFGVVVWGVVKETACGTIAPRFEFLDTKPS